MIFAWIEERHDEWPITVLCRVLGVSRSGFYAWRSRDASAAEERREELAEEVKAIHAQVKARYGSPRIHASDNGTHGVQRNIHLARGQRLLYSGVLDLDIPNIGESLGLQQRFGHILRRDTNGRSSGEPDSRRLRRRFGGNHVPRIEAENSRRPRYCGHTLHEFSPVPITAARDFQISAVIDCKPVVRHIDLLMP